MNKIKICNYIICKINPTLNGKLEKKKQRNTSSNFVRNRDSMYK